MEWIYELIIPDSIEFLNIVINIRGLPPGNPQKRCWTGTKDNQLSQHCEGFFAGLEKFPLAGGKKARKWLPLSAESYPQQQSGVLLPWKSHPTKMTLSWVSATSTIRWFYNFLFLHFIRFLPDKFDSWLGRLAGKFKKIFEKNFLQLEIILFLVAWSAKSWTL